MDDNGDGTHVAGIIGAVGNNGIGVVGVNWSVTAACKFLDSQGSGSTDAAIECLQYVKTLRYIGVNIVATNNSWGGGGYSQALYDAIRVISDSLFIAAAGNKSSNNDISSSYPANYDLPQVISVAATDVGDSLGRSRTTVEILVAVGAPVTNIRTSPANNDVVHFRRIWKPFRYLNGNTPCCWPCGSHQGARPNQGWTNHKELDSFRRRRYPCSGR